MTRPSEFQGTDRYRILRRLGAGAMGVVYEAEDCERGQRVALKMLKRADSEALYRIKREFRALADLHHTNLVALYDLIVGKECFFTMELLHGTDLLGYLVPEAVLAHAPTVAGPVPWGEAEPQDTLPSPRQGPIDRGNSTPVAPRPAWCDEGRLRLALPQLAEGLIALHAAGKIHRDVKPSNIFVTREERVVLCDFGLVAEADFGDMESVAGGFAGTAAYMAPEQCRSDPRLGPAADWYAVGVVLYEALTGRFPFDGTVMQMLSEKQTRAPVPPRALVPTVPPDLDDLCIALLQRHPSDRPRGDEVLRRLGVGAGQAVITQHAASASPRASPFFGRDAELFHLDAALTAMFHTGAAAILLRGPSGIGKTALLQRFIERARDDYPDLVVLQGRCYEREAVPYPAMDSLVDHLSHYWLTLPSKDSGTLLPREAGLLPKVFPVLGRVPCVAEAPRGRDIADPHELRTRAFAALREVIQRIAARHPLVLLLDDLQWVDASTLALLSDLMRSPDPPTLLLLLSTRPEGSAALEGLMHRMDAASSVLDLEPLSQRAATELAWDLLGGEDAGLAAEVAAEASYNPFFIGELSQYVRTVEKGSHRMGSVRLDELIAQRVAQLSGTQRRILELVALAGEPLTRRALGSAVGVPPSELNREAGSLRMQRFLRGVGTRGDHRLEPYHDRVRNAVLAALAEDARRLRHRALALALEEWGETSREQLARHWRGAGDGARAAEHARKGAEDALARLDFERAAGLFRMALDVGGAQGGARRELLSQLGGALGYAGRPREAAHAFHQASEGADPAVRIELQRRSAEELLRGGYLEEGLAAIRTVLAEFDLRLAKTPLRALLSALLRRAWLRLRGLGWRARSVSDIRPRDLVKQDVLDSVALGLGFVDTFRGFDYQTRGLLCALRLGEPGRLARVLALECAYLAGVGDLRRARRTLAFANRAAAQSQSPYGFALASLGQGILHFFAGHTWRAAADELRKAERLFLAQGRAGWEVDTAQHYQSFSLLYLGEVLELSKRIPGYVREAERRGDQFASAALRTRLNIIWLARDDAARAQEDVDSAIASWLPPERVFLVQHYWALLARAEAALYAGAIESGIEGVERGLAGLRRSLLLQAPMVRIELSYLRGRLALARAAAGEDPSSRTPQLSEARRLARSLARGPLPIARSFALLLYAGVANLEGRPEQAKAFLEEALASLEASETLLFAAGARRRLGETLGGEEGRAEQERAESWMRSQGIQNPTRMAAMLVPGWR
jgi:serine/threonine protein kinase